MNPREIYEHACLHYLMLAFNLADFIMAGDHESILAVQEAAREMTRKRCYLVPSTV